MIIISNHQTLICIIVPLMQSIYSYSVRWMSQSHNCHVTSPLLQYPYFKKISTESLCSAMLSTSLNHGAHSKDEIVPLQTLLHPQFTPRRNEIQYIKDRASKKPDRQRIIQQRYIFKYFLAITILWLITDSNVRYWYSTGDTKSLSIFHALQLFSLFLYHFLIHSNPGYLPINDFNMQQKLKSQQTQSHIQKPTNIEDEVIVEQDDMENATLITKRTLETLNIRTVDLSGIVIPRGFCERCKLYKPERCKHCYVCDRCVIKFDHHCPLIDNCIGIGNYHYLWHI